MLSGWPWSVVMNWKVMLCSQCQWAASYCCWPKSTRMIFVIALTETVYRQRDCNFDSSTRIQVAVWKYSAASRSSYYIGIVRDGTSQLYCFVWQFFYITMIIWLTYASQRIESKQMNNLLTHIRLPPERRGLRSRIRIIKYFSKASMTWVDVTYFDRNILVHLLYIFLVTET